jgi:flagellar M-ring protein FliF
LINDGTRDDMTRLNGFFSEQRTGARLGLIIGAAIIVAATVAGGWFLMRTDYQVLFADLSPQDVAAMTGELDRLKVPYVVEADEGHPDAGASTILVDRNDVYRTRLKLMSKDIPLHGAVGFELFNNSDLGMTEFVQKINLQRALQGELTRTILSLSQVRDARVLLAMPEQGLFKQASSRPTASVTLSMKAGQRLRPDQVSGVQRLVAAAIPGVLAQDVTIVDQSGVALTRSAADAADPESAGSARLDLKQDTENYLARKATAVLDRALGAGAATTSVDVTLNMDRVQTNTEEVLGAPGKAGDAPVGLISKERESTHDIGAPVMPDNGTAGRGAQGGSNQHEVEYALGRRVEQVINQPGSIKHMQVAVVVHRSLSAAQLEQLKQTVGAAVGASFDRGDAVVVQSTDGFLAASHAPAAFAGEGDAAAAARAGSAVDASSAMAVATHASHRAAVSNWMLMLLALLGLALLAALAGVLIPRRTSEGAARRLSDAERELALAKLRVWLAEEGLPAKSSQLPELLK